MSNRLWRGGINLWRRPVAFAARHLMGTITHVESAEPVAALTFDDGPHPTYTPRLLDVLGRFQARATFFMVGEAAHAYAALVEQVAHRGHAIGNHSWDHRSFPLISRRQRREQVRACAKALAPHGRRLFRPPYGEQSWASRFDLWWLGYQVVAWNLDVGDWWNPDARTMAEAVAKRIRPGSVVVFHDAIFDGGKPTWGPGLPREALVDRGPMLAAVTALLERLTPEFRFVTIPELLQSGRPRRQDWYKVTPGGATASSNLAEARP